MSGVRAVETGVSRTEHSCEGDRDWEEGDWGDRDRYRDWEEGDWETETETGRRGDWLTDTERRGDRDSKEGRLGDRDWEDGGGICCGGGRLPVRQDTAH